jgi:hypothetical protein
MQLLWSVLDAPDSRSDDKAQVTENAISAQAKVILARQAEIDAPANVERWLAHLPVTVDEVEARVIHLQLVSMLEQFPDAVLGPAPQRPRLSFLLNVIGDALETDRVTPEVTAAFARVLAHLSSSLPAELLQAAWGALDEPVRAKLQRVGSE